MKNGNTGYWVYIGKIYLVEGHWGFKVTGYFNRNRYYMYTDLINLLNLYLWSSRLSWFILIQPSVFGSIGLISIHWSQRLAGISIRSTCTMPSKGWCIDYRQWIGRAKICLNQTQHALVIKTWPAIQRASQTIEPASSNLNQQHDIYMKSVG